MFSSNQVLKISGDLSHKGDLYNALKYVLGQRNGWYSDKLAEVNVFQITADGRYVLGRLYDDKQNDAWVRYPFEVTLDILVPIITQFLEKQELSDEDEGDGGYNKGFLIENVDDEYSGEHGGIKDIGHGIISIAPYTCYYSK